MTTFARIISVCALISACAAVPTRHTEPALSGAWTTSASEVKKLQRDVRVTFHVRERNHDIIRNAALEISDPDHPRFGQFMSKQEVDNITAPAVEDLQTVHAWLESVPGVTLSFMREDGRAVAATMPVAIAESLFRTTFRLLTNSQTGQQALRASEFTLPPQVAAATQSLSGLHGLPLPPRSFTLDAAASPAKPASVTPAVITKQYGITGVKVDRSSSNRQAVAEFEGQTMSSKDLNTAVVMMRASDELLIACYCRRSTTIFPSCFPVRCRMNASGTASIPLSTVSSYNRRPSPTRPASAAITGGHLSTLPPA